MSGGFLGRLRKLKWKRSSHIVGDIQLLEVLNPDFNYPNQFELNYSFFIRLFQVPGTLNTLN